jgi:hypothetical protein
MAWALLVGFVVAATATLYCQYSYPTPASEETRPKRNWFGAEYIPKRDVATAMFYKEQNRWTPQQHSTPVQVAVGFTVTALLEFASLRWANWPILPVGYVTSYGAFMGNAWFSIFLGWLAKVLIVKFGGSSLYLKSKPLFIGLIFGEALAGGFWLIINAVVVLSGGDPKPVRILI